MSNERVHREDPRLTKQAQALCAQAIAAYAKPHQWRAKAFACRLHEIRGLKEAPWADGIGYIRTRKAGYFWRLC